MNKKNPVVVVYCASSSEIDKTYFKDAEKLGVLLARNNVTCITGAGKQGLMGVLNDTVLNNGGKVKGIIPEFMVDAGWCHDGLTETVITNTIHERKEQMARLSDAAIALPGGIGTLEELSEIITWKQLGLFKNPVILLNTNNYYDPLLTFFESMIEQKFMDPSYANLLQVASSPEEVITILRNNSDWNPAFIKNHKKEL
ncbi:MAG: TIGR00730 family Rossman fold protein [Fermentimonas sp.]|nr:TIGR00730 family Rossman fold protein [Fermentimonas sp.]MDD4008387.1 TIGR00730 family Rossman fold protein [Fermentimonas sp.]MDD4696427.1 TIGR00730 family Rossman fold protein [Fermentimonas sp.]